MQTVRIIFAIASGAILAMLCIAVIETVGHAAFPPPPGTDATDPAQLARLMENVPAAALAFVAAGWFIGAFAGALAANLLARRARAGWAVAAMVVAGGVFTMVEIPHPLWMWAMGLTLPLLAGWLAHRCARAAWS